MAFYGEPNEISRPRLRTAAVFALAPRHVRTWLVGREALLRSSPHGLETLEDGIRSWLGTRKPKTFAYFGPANDASLIGPAQTTFGYNHFLYIDVAPGWNGLYNKQTMTRLRESLKRQLAKQAYVVHRVVPDPANSRFVMFLTAKSTAYLPRFIQRTDKKNAVLEYFYDTQFEMLETLRARQRFRPLLASKLKEAYGLSSRGSFLPRVRFSTLFPRVKQTWEVQCGIDDLLNSTKNKEKLIRTSGIRSGKFERAMRTTRNFHNQEILKLSNLSNKPVLPRYASNQALFTQPLKRWVHKNTERNVPRGLGLGFGGLLPTPRLRKLKL